MAFRALSAPRPPPGPNPPPKLRVFPFVWPGLAPSDNFGGIPKEGGGGGLWTRMPRDKSAGEGLENEDCDSRDGTPAFSISHFTGDISCALLQFN